MRRMLTAKLQNRSGVLNRFTGVLSRRQVNIESISVGATENPDVSRITIIIDVNSHNEVEQIIKQLNRQIDVIRTGSNGPTLAKSHGSKMPIRRTSR